MALLKSFKLNTSSFRTAVASDRPRERHASFVDGFTVVLVFKDRRLFVIAAVVLPVLSTFIQASTEAEGDTASIIVSA